MNYKKFREEAKELIINEIIKNPDLEIEVYFKLNEVDLNKAMFLSTTEGLNNDFKLKLEKLISRFTNNHYYKMNIELLKSVWFNLESRAKNPKGNFNKEDGFFYLENRDLSEDLNVHPTNESPLREMDFGRTFKFINLLAEKYNCQNLKELEDVAYGEKNIFPPLGEK